MAAMAKTVRVTESGRVALEDGEIALGECGDVTLEVRRGKDGNVDVARAKGRGTATNRRLIVVDASTGGTLWVDYAEVRETERRGGRGVFGNGKTETLCRGGAALEDGGLDSSTGRDLDARASARGKVGEAFGRAIESGVRKHRESMSRVARERTGGGVYGGTRTVGSTAATAGVAGAVNRQRVMAEVTNKTLNEAFSDLEALMAKANELVKLAERLAESSDGEGGDDGSDARRLALRLGIKSPVTRAATGDDYHTELGKQLGDWIKPVLARSKGIIGLTDAFCLFNRARGMELVTPRDMLRACESWEAARVRLYLRTFESGVTVIHTREWTDTRVSEQFRAALPDFARSLSSYDAAQILETTPEIALEYLRTAESAGVLCRDDGPGELRFYANKFADYLAALK